MAYYNQMGLNGPAEWAQNQQNQQQEQWQNIMQLMMAAQQEKRRQEQQMFQNTMEQQRLGMEQENYASEKETREAEIAARKASQEKDEPWLARAKALAAAQGKPLEQVITETYGPKAPKPYLTPEQIGAREAARQAAKAPYRTAPAPKSQTPARPSVWDKKKADLDIKLQKGEISQAQYNQSLYGVRKDPIQSLMDFFNPGQTTNPAPSGQPTTPVGNAQQTGPPLPPEVSDYLQKNPNFPVGQAMALYQQWKSK